MKKKIILGLLVVSCLFTITGCGVKESTNNSKTDNKKSTKSVSKKESTEKKKEEFTKTISLEDFHIEYKLPENSISEYDFEDMECSVIIDVSEYETDDSDLHINDNKAEKIETSNINGYSFEHYKYSQEDGVTYVYRTQVNGKYYLFSYNVYGSDYDDSQVEKFINTVIFK